MKTVDFSETFEACGLQVSRWRQLIEFIKVCESFLDLAEGHLHMKIKTCFSQKPPSHFYQILYVNFKVHGNEPNNQLNVYTTSVKEGEVACVKLILALSNSLLTVPRQWF